MSATAEAPSRRRLCETDRARLLRDAAETVFLRDGYAAARMDDVAQLAGMSKRTLYQHFPSKAALFGAVMEDCLRPFALDSSIDSEPDLAFALRSMLAALARHLFEPRQVAIFRIIIGEVKTSPELGDAFSKAGPEKGAGALERRLAREIAEGRLLLPDATEAAHMLFGMAIGAAHTFLLLGLRGPPSGAEIDQMVSDAIAVFLRGALRAP